MRRVRTQARAAGVPAEMMQLVADIRHAGLADLPAVALRRGIDVHDADGVGCATLLRVDERHIGELFGGRLHRHLRRWIERGIRLEQWHDEPPEEWRSILARSVRPLPRIRENA